MTEQGAIAGFSNTPRRAHVSLRSARGDDGVPFSLGAPQKPGQSPEQRAREAAEEFVSVTLVEPVLASLRESNWAAPPFAPGDAERTFRPMLDARVAQEVVRSANFPLVDVVASRLLNMSRKGAAPAAPAGGTVDAHA